jgi:hypothetical protein
VESLQRALDFASSNGLNRQVFEAEAAIGDAKRGRIKSANVPSSETWADVKDVADRIESLKLAAGV